ncbi:MAG: hypothetical protein NTZ64_10120, partial [Polaromonas sp.]|nr:hypothetical protein [Polaromonas sp.]
KIDAYYCSDRMPNPPKSVDYIVIVKCCDNNYNLYVIELSNVKSTRGVKQHEIYEKFQTVFFDFFEKKFPTIFKNPELGKFNKIELFIITDPLNLATKNLSDLEISRHLRGTVLDAFANFKPFIFNEQILIIKPKLPNPTINECTDADQPKNLETT